MTTDGTALASGRCAEMQGMTYIPEEAPFTREQRLWLNGYMAGLLTGKGYVPAPAGNGAALAASAIPLIVLFGSQTGTAQNLASRIAKEAALLGIAARVVDAADHGKIDWSKETNLLVVTSTYGDGDMPDNAQPFWDWLQGDAASTMAHLTFAVLGLGDTNYEQFCAAGKKIDARLGQIGARRVHPFIDCDLDYEAKAKEWMTGVFKALTPTSHAGTAAVDNHPDPS